jgi:HEAT repeat protein
MLPSRAAQAEEEQQLIVRLQSNASLKDKDEACARLKWIGTTRSVPALSALLLDEQLSHSARYALESLPLQDAENALLNALGKSSGLVRVGLINSLGNRAELTAVPALTKLLNDPDPVTASASARALGQIPGSQALKALQAYVRKSVPSPVHEAVVDALLRCGNRLLADGDDGKARSLFQQLYGKEKEPRFQVAAYAGMIRASGHSGLSLMTRALAGPSGSAQLAAFQLAPELNVPGTTEALAALLPRLKTPLQIALVESLSQRGDPAAAPALTALASSCSPQVHPAIIEALGKMGGPSVIPLISGFAVTGTPEARKAARRALLELHRGNMTEALVRQLPLSSPDVQAELARAIGYRGEDAAVPKLLELAEGDAEPVRKAALQGLGMLVNRTQAVLLVEYVLKTKDAPSREAAAGALNTAYQRLQLRRGQFNVEPLVEGIGIGSPEAKIALLPICSGLVSPRVRLALRGATADPDSRVRAAAVRALCDSIDVDLWEEMVNVARQSKDQNERSLATATAVRVLTQEEAAKFSTGQRSAIFAGLLSTANRPEDKRVVLSGLAELPNIEALRVVESALDDQALQNEAARAAIKIAVALPSSEAQNCEAVLQKAVANSADPATRKAVEETIKQIEATADYLTDWHAAGPFRQQDKDYAALFEIIFPPERGDAKDVLWRPLPAGTDPKRPFVMDLLKLLGGEQCVAYARTWVRSDREVPALLELGSDDGVKVWLNDRQVYALNAARPLQPGSDKVKVTLHSGWNNLLLKVTQNNLAWEFCVRFRNQDGTHIDGLRCDAAPQESTPLPPGGATNAPPTPTGQTNSPPTTATNVAPPVPQTNAPPQPGSLPKR